MLHLIRIKRLFCLVFHLCYILNTWLRVKSMNLPKPEELDGLENLWIVGPTGCGKSLWVHRTYPGCYKKAFNKWWCGFDSDDPEHAVVQLMDLSPTSFVVNIPETYIPEKYIPEKKIIFTSFNILLGYL